jgi:hypothetical protein
MDGVFVLRMITIHTSTMFCTDIVDAMWDYFIEETEAEQKLLANGRQSIDKKPLDDKQFGDSTNKINEERSDNDDDDPLAQSALNLCEHCFIKSSSAVAVRPPTAATTQAVCLPTTARRRNDGLNTGQQRGTFASRLCTFRWTTDVHNATL